MSFLKLRRGLVLLLVALSPSLQPFQSQASPVPAGPLPSSETLDYNVEWRLITAGKAHVRFAADADNGFATGVRVESAGVIAKFFKVDDKYSSVLDGSLCAHSAIFKTHEGSRNRETEISFDQERRKAIYLERDTAKNSVLASRETDVPPCVCDIVGALYRVRTLNLAAGQTARVPVTDGKKSALARVDCQRQEVVKTPAGSFKTFRYEAYLFDDVIYHRSGRVFLWLTDDSRRLPVQIQVRLQLAIGTITLQLEKEGT